MKKDIIYKSQEEKFRAFREDMQKIVWWPVPAAFQLSPNRQWGRHDDWKFLAKEKRERIEQEIWKCWGLLAVIDDGTYCYFGQPWERTRIVEFIGDIETPTTTL